MVMCNAKIGNAIQKLKMRKDSGWLFEHHPLIFFTTSKEENPPSQKGQPRPPRCHTNHVSCRVGISISVGSPMPKVGKA
jgi:hypothetical protein